jgi:hypothetical protein
MSERAQERRSQRDQIGFSWHGAALQAIQAYILRPSTVVSGVHRKIIWALAPPASLISSSPSEGKLETAELQFAMQLAEIAIDPLCEDGFLRSFGENGKRDVTQLTVQETAVILPSSKCPSRHFGHPVLNSNLSVAQT